MLCSDVCVDYLDCGHCFASASVCETFQSMYFKYVSLLYAYTPQ